jgi:hypothetical protein
MVEKYYILCVRVTIRAVAEEVGVDDVAVTVNGLSLILQETNKIYLIVYL